jgi:2-C-methyl-D-erythritol 2,4-cyclodiphosphate synthase
LLHAICDAILGALALGDIGRHFPDSDPAYKGINSMLLLERVVTLMQQQQWAVGNIDAIIIAEKPKVSPYVEQMCVNLAAAVHTTRPNVNIKATTTEGLGFTGRAEGIAAQAVVSLVTATFLS